MCRTSLTTRAKVQNIDKRSMRSADFKGVDIKIQHAGKRLRRRADRYDVTSNSVKRQQNFDANHHARTKAFVLKHSTPAKSKRELWTSTMPRATV